MFRLYAGKEATVCESTVLPAGVYWVIRKVKSRACKEPETCN